MTKEKIYIFDTTLRDGNQTPGVDFTVDDKNRISKKNKNIDALIYVTQSPEYHLPTNACLIQNKLGLNNKIFSFDLNQGCLHFQ